MRGRRNAEGKGDAMRLLIIILVILVSGAIGMATNPPPPVSWLLGVITGMITGAITRSGR